MVIIERKTLHKIVDLLADDEITLVTEYIFSALLTDPKLAKSQETIINAITEKVKD